MDYDALLHALAKVESDGGRNNWPRVEVSYLPKGYTATCQGKLLLGTGKNFNSIVETRWHVCQTEHRLGTAASWGPWQILYHTAADCGFAGMPYELHNKNTSLPWVRRRLEIIWNNGGRTVEEFARAWNGGNIHANYVPEAYVVSVLRYYDGWRSP
jgi:hypothetical protein